MKDRFTYLLFDRRVYLHSIDQALASLFALARTKSLSLRFICIAFPTPREKKKKRHNIAFFPTFFFFRFLCIPFRFILVLIEGFSGVGGSIFCACVCWPLWGDTTLHCVFNFHLLSLSLLISFFFSTSPPSLFFTRTHAALRQKEKRCGS